MKRKVKIMVLVMLVVLVLSPCVGMAESGGSAAQQRPVIDLSNLIAAIFALIATLITSRLIPWIKSKTTAAQQEMLQAAINTAVYAAEQIYGAGHGDEKLKYAMESLKLKGYYADSKAVKDGVEAAVKALTLQQTQMPAVVVGETLELPNGSIPQD